MCIAVYVVLVGGDWMPYYRFLSPFEPFCFLLVDYGVRTVVDWRERATNLAFAVFALAFPFRLACRRARRRFS